MNLAIEDGRSWFYQWDTDQRLLVTDEPLREEVHFCHIGDEKALVCKIREVQGKCVVDVPNILLQRAGTMMAYLSAQTETGRQVKHVNSFCVRPRSKPENYVYTQTEVLNYATLSDRLAKLEGEGVADAVEDYLAKNPVQAGATAEEAEQIRQNKTDIQQLTQDKLDASKLPEAVNEALFQAKLSGEFDGKDGQDGKNYVLTDTDKKEIAGLIEVSEIDSSLLAVTFTDEDGTLTPSHTFEQIKEWVDNGGSAVLTDGNNWFPLVVTSGGQVYFELIFITAARTRFVRYVITILGKMDRIVSEYEHINVTAEVGQTIAVKSIDEKGKPTEWEAVNFPKGTVTDEQIADAVEDYMAEHPVSGGSGGLIITDDDNGNVTIESAGSVTISDDGFGNVVIV